MTIILTVIHVLVCFVLIAVILLQAGRGQGLGGAAFGSGNVQSLFGTRAADFLTKATTVAAVCFLLTCIGLDFLEVRKNKSLMDVGRKVEQIDVDAIRKALEKVKEQEATGLNVEGVAEKAASAEQNVTASVEKEPVNQIPESVES